MTPGSALAVAVWIVASAAFAVYIANFGSYNRTYGSLAAVVVFLVWLWLANTAILLGVEFDAALARGRAIQAGHPPGREPYVEPRDTRKRPEWTVPALASAWLPASQPRRPARSMSTPGMSPR